jgi:two-component system NarL family response regulator
LLGKGNAEEAGLRVLLADDHALFLEGLRTLLTLRGMQVVGLAFNGEEAVTQAQALLPDLVLMDINMPRCDGITATRRIKEALPATQIVILTMASDDEALFTALKAGASGYLLKGLDSDEFYRLLHELVQGEIPLAPGMARRILQTFVPPSEAGLPELTLQQNSVLELLAQGMTYKEIGQRLKLSERTVRYHVEQILIRLRVDSRRAAVDYYTRHFRDGLTNASSDV